MQLLQLLQCTEEHDASLVDDGYLITQALCNLQYMSGKEYGVSLSAVSRWVKQYSEVKLDDDSVISAQQIKELQKRNAMLEEENLILKKAIAIFTPHSQKD